MRRIFRHFLTGIGLALLLGLTFGAVLRVPLASLLPVGLLVGGLGLVAYISTRQRRLLIILLSAGAVLFFGSLLALALSLALAPQP